LFKIKGIHMVRRRTVFITIMILFIVAVMAALLFAGCLADQVSPYYNDSDERREETASTITVTGSGSHRVVPDKAMVNISIFNEEDTSQKAVDLNSSITEKVMETIGALEVRDLEIRTVSFNLIPLYTYRGEDKPPEVYAYRATTVLEASTVEIDEIGRIISSSIEAGANDVSSLSFGLSDDLEKESKKSALGKAAMDGKDKAYAIANSLGVEITDIYYVSEIETYSPGPVILRELEAAAGELPESEGVSPIPVAPDEVEVTAAIKMTYLFR
jgi:uncharacterized protein